MSTRPPKAFYVPASTEDYYIKNDDEIGVGLVASRNIKKGNLIFRDSIEYLFSDVAEGDYLLLQGHHEASKKSKSKVPATFPVTREMLLRTHGVPVLATGGTIRWRLEMPGMLMNHSCDPTVTDDSHDVCEGEAYATRDIQKGEELTYNYLLQYYDRGPFFDECRCGSANCLGKMTGFKELGEEDKAKYLPLASGAVQAMHKADIVEGPGPKPSEELIVVPRSEESAATGTDTTRLVFPGPSCALAKIEIKQHDNGMHALYAVKDFCFGDRVYEFWTKDWPFGGRGPIDMVASTKLAHGDLPEGTTIHLLPTECAAQKDRSGHYKFSGWDLLVQHSCEPNLAYNDLHEEEDDDWRGAYAVRAITKGEKLTVDFNCILWDRSDSMNADECHCGAAKCVGTMKGFKFLPTDAQHERKMMTWRRVLPPYEGEKDAKCLGMGLTPHVRQQWRAEAGLSVDCPETASSSSSSSDDDSSDEE